MKKTIKKVKDLFSLLIKIAVVVAVAGIAFFIYKERSINAELSEIKEDKQVNIIKDTSSVFDGLNDFAKREEVKRKVELVEKEAFLNHRREVLTSKYELEIAEIEAELDTVRGELAVQ
jgi:hypothetical protein